MLDLDLDFKQPKVCGVRKYVMIICNVLCLSSKSLTLRKQLFYIGVHFVLFEYLESAFYDPTENRT